MNPISYLKKKREINHVVIVYPFTYINPYYALPPIAAEYLQAGVLETKTKVTLLDMRYEKNVSEYLKTADLVCLYGYFEDCSIFGKWKIHIIPEVLSMIPETTPVVAGGTGFKDYEEVFRIYPKIDVIIRGNPEIPIMELLNSGSPENVKNLVYRKDDKAVYTERVIHPLLENIYPRRRFRNPKYNYHVMGIKTDLLRAGIGCNYRCKFCFEYGKDFDGDFMRWQGRSAKSLLQEIQEIDASIVGWVDDDMTADMKTLEDLSDLLIANKIQKLYGGTGRIDHVLKSSVETLKKMEKAGVIALSFGVESLKDETLKLYGKGQNVKNVEKAMQMMQETNILLICNFILGSPGETEKDIMDMLWFGRRWNVDTLVTNRFRLQEDSPLYDIVYDRKTGKVREGMERVEGDALARIKYKVKFGQRTPFRMILSLLKLYRHEGMFIEPLYLLCCALETITRHTILEKTKIFPLAIKGAKTILVFAPVRHFFRITAVLLTPVIRFVNAVFEAIDKKLEISTGILPSLFSYLDKKVYKKQRIKAQVNSPKPHI